jgi:hypothetical protein
MNSLVVAKITELSLGRRRRAVFILSKSIQKSIRFGGQLERGGLGVLLGFCAA